VAPTQAPKPPKPPACAALCALSNSLTFLWSSTLVITARVLLSSAHFSPVSGSVSHSVLASAHVSAPLVTSSKSYLKSRFGLCFKSSSYAFFSSSSAFWISPLFFAAYQASGITVFSSFGSGCILILSQWPVYHYPASPTRCSFLVITVPHNLSGLFLSAFLAQLEKPGRVGIFVLSTSAIIG